MYMNIRHVDNQPAIFSRPFSLQVEPLGPMPFQLYARKHTLESVLHRKVSIEHKIRNGTEPKDIPTKKYFFTDKWQ